MLGEEQHFVVDGFEEERYPIASKKGGTISLPDPTVGGDRRNGRRPRRCGYQLVAKAKIQEEQQGALLRITATGPRPCAPRRLRSGN